MKFHAVLLDECGGEFGVTVDAADRATARSILREDYPESRVVQLESPEDTRQRERDMHAHIMAGGDWDDEGRPIYHYAEPDYDDDYREDH